MRTTYEPVEVTPESHVDVTRDGRDLAASSSGPGRSPGREPGAAHGGVRSDGTVGRRDRLGGLILES